MNNVEWLFFDVGSTLINEEKAYLHRLHDVADAVNEPFEKIYDKVIRFYKENRKGDLEIMQLYGLPILKWHQDEQADYEVNNLTSLLDLFER